MSRDGRAALPHGARGLSAVFPDHTHLLFFTDYAALKKKLLKFYCIQPNNP